MSWKPSDRGRQARPPGPAPRVHLTRRGRIVAVLVVIAGLLAAGLATGFGTEASAEPTAQAFLLDWQQQRYAAASSLTTAAPGTVSAALKGAFTQLDATQLLLSMNSVTQHGGTAQASFTASIDLAGQGRVWSYHGHFALSSRGGSWKVQWAPDVIYPGLSAGERLAVVSQFPARAPVLDSSGQPLQVMGSAYVLGVYPGRLAHPAVTAQDFANVTKLDATQVLGQIAAAPPQQFLRLAALDPTTYGQLQARLRRVPGLVVQRQQERLFQAEASGLIGQVGGETSAALRDEGAYYLPGTTVGLSGLEQAYQRQLMGTPATRIVAVSAAGTEAGVLASWPAQPGTALRTTISSSTQNAALSALNAVAGSAEIVAVQASTGKVLAVAQRHGPGAPTAADALTARLTPGTAFTIVSAAALLRSGLSTQSQLSCQNSFTVGGQTFTSDGSGQAEPFSDDFAQACGTAFAGAAQRLTASQFDEVVKEFGIGADWSGLPVPAFSGSVPSGAAGAELAEQIIGLGNVRMSPLAMAMVAATVDSGSWHTPRILASAADPSGLALSPSDMSALRSLMRAAVRSGAAQAASRPGAPVYGQVGLVRSGGTWTSWFVGFRGDTAFTVIESGPTSRLSAAALAGAFLRALGR